MISKSIFSPLPRSIAAGGIVGLTLLAVFLWEFGTGVTTDDLGYAIALKAILTLGPVVLAGAPVVLFVRYGTVTPVIIGVLLVVAALISGGSGETPLFVLLVAGWPYCLAVYLALAGGEYALRHQEVFS
jgi:hypothetical protein